MLTAVKGDWFQEADAMEVIQKNFQGVFPTMLTLVQFTTGDITEIYFPLVMEQPWLVLYFGAAFFVITILLMNFVTANLVNDAIAHSKQDQEMRFRKLQKQIDGQLPVLNDLFQELDKDGTG